MDHRINPDLGLLLPLRICCFACLSRSGGIACTIHEAVRGAAILRGSTADRLLSAIVQRGPGGGLPCPVLSKVSWRSAGGRCSMGTLNISTTAVHCGLAPVQSSSSLITVAGLALTPKAASDHQESRRTHSTVHVSRTRRQGHVFHQLRTHFMFKGREGKMWHGTAEQSAWRQAGSEQADHMQDMARKPGWVWLL